MTVGSRSLSPSAVRARRTGRAWWRCRWPISMHRSRRPVADGRTGGSSSCSPAGLAAWFTARQVEQPLRALSDQVTGAKNQVSELSGQLLALQEEERQRIARELHDSTAQHLVAANLGLASLEGASAEPGGPQGLGGGRGPARPRRCGNCASSPTCCIRRTWRRTASRPRCGISPRALRGGRGSSPGSGFRRRLTTCRRSSSGRSCAWCRRRSPTCIAMPMPRMCRSMPGSCPDA